MIWKTNGDRGCILRQCTNLWGDTGWALRSVQSTSTTPSIVTYEPEILHSGNISSDEWESPSVVDKGNATYTKLANMVRNNTDLVPGHKYKVVGNGVIDPNTGMSASNGEIVYVGGCRPGYTYSKRSESFFYKKDKSICCYVDYMDVIPGGYSYFGHYPYYYLDKNNSSNNLMKNCIGASSVWIVNQFTGAFEPKDWSAVSFALANNNYSTYKLGKGIVYDDWDNKVHRRSYTPSQADKSAGIAVPVTGGYLGGTYFDYFTPGSLRDRPIQWNGEFLVATSYGCEPVGVFLVEKYDDENKLGLCGYWTPTYNNSAEFSMRLTGKTVVINNETLSVWYVGVKQWVTCHGNSVDRNGLVAPMVAFTDKNKLSHVTAAIIAQYDNFKEMAY